MKKDFRDELPHEVRSKMKMNLVYVAIFSIVMLFGGLISAYIVTMGDAFWLKADLPTAFWISTSVILISSLTFILAVNAIKKGNEKLMKLFITITFILGIGFVYFQFRGYSELVENGIHGVSSGVLVNEGRYGNYFKLKYKGNYLEVDGNNYYLAGKLATETEKKEISNFAAQFIDLKTIKDLKNVKSYGNDFMLLYKNNPLVFSENQFVLPDGSTLKNTDVTRLRMFAYHLKDGRGDFFAKGEYGKDFKLYFKQKELTYKDRVLYAGNKKLTPYEQNKALESWDAASAFLYIITFLHLLHIIVTLLFMVKTVTYSYTGRYTDNDYIGLNVTGVFWHFLGLLWVVLLLFLLFIH